MKYAILSGGSITDYDFTLRLIRDCDVLICADAGIRHAEKMGVIADIAIGDFDSLGFRPDYCRECITLPTEKDDTDTMSAARLTVERGADSVVLLACSGTRLDHTYANLFVLSFLERHGIDAFMADEHNEVRIVSDSVRIKRSNSAYLSLLPFCCIAKGVSVSGVKYPLNNAALDSEFPIGVSNEITENFADIDIKSGSLAVFISRD